MIYSFLLCNCTLLPLVLNMILPAWMHDVFSWLNFRVLYFLLIPNVVLYIAWNAVIKNRTALYLFRYETIIVTELTMFVLFRDPLNIIAGLKINRIMYLVFIIGILGYYVAKLQYKYGSRFFLPNRCRRKIFEYRRRIAEDFNLTKLDESSWPEWDFWSQKLHLPSLHTGNRNLGKIEGKEWYEIYMKTKDEKKMHYFWLLKAIDQHYLQIGFGLSIDDYDY